MFKDKTKKYFLFLVKYGKKYLVFTDWIKPIYGGAKAYCKWCKAELAPRTNILQKHAKSRTHNLSYLATRPISQSNGISQSESQQNVGGRCNEMQSDANRLVETRVALYQALHGKLNSSDHLLQIMKTVGHVSEKTKVKRTKCAKIIINTLAPLFRKFLISDMLVKSCSFFLDESTDISGCSFLGKEFVVILKV